MPLALCPSLALLLHHLERNYCQDLNAKQVKRILVLRTEYSVQTIILYKIKT